MAPIRANAPIQLGVSLDSSRTLNIDIPAATLSGSITVNGALPGAPVRVSLRNAATADSVPLTQAASAPYAPLRIIPGTYDIHYDAEATPAVGLPRNVGTVLRSGVALTGSQTLDIDIPTVSVSTPDGVMSAYELIPDGEGRRPAIVFLMDGLGYRTALKAMAERLASHGYHVILPDLYHRVGKHVHFEPIAMMQPETMAEMRKLIGNLTPDMLMRDVAACLDVLASRPSVDATRVGAVGYCMGGRNAFIAATRLPDRLRATASIHPGGIVLGDPASPHLFAAPAQARMYFGIAKDDVFFTKEQAETLDQTLAALGKRYQIEHYEARHGWAVTDTPVYDAAEAERHWKAILALFAEELGA